MNVNQSEGRRGGQSVSHNMDDMCDHNMVDWEKQMDTLYTYFYLFLFFPGLLLNTVALWVLCRHISKKMKTAIFMINLAFADLAHVLSLPLRIYYYFTHTWPFGHAICLFCFYLKYLNMYAAIGFLVCISVQRCVFLLKPFFACRWRKRYDLLISVVVWLVVGMACSPFVLVRDSSQLTDPGNGSLSYKPQCFKDLPTRKLPLPTAVTMIVLGELFGFLLPLAAISYSSVRIAHSLLTAQGRDPGGPQPRGHANRPLSSSSSFSSSLRPHDPQTEAASNRQSAGDKARALRMVLSCTTLFLICYAPYHVNFLLYLMVEQGLVSNCSVRLATKQLHPVSLCLSSISCCLNPLLYYFLTTEFRLHLSSRASSLASTLISSPVGSKLLRKRLVSTEGPDPHT
ncbi:hypothetical protein NHX12_011375 [Muraenolepis orangiensis]|uniref:G-protein coupled receptors family 1 profile domain-containing protein n=1 Tax=Muraenolepis orangiensis TaxID=630683 RepID=A0A9Q0DF31_9TELE|nr:hypothetical protein NHX12_011375 [Muraenolepis orangiensis]